MTREELMAMSKEALIDMISMDMMKEGGKCEGEGMKPAACKGEDMKPASCKS